DMIDPEGPPIQPAEWHGDLDPGLWAVIAILGALRHRDKTGEGQLIDVSQLDCMIAQTGVSLTRYTMSGELPWQARSKYIGLSTFGLFKAEDGWVYIAADPHMRDRLVRAMGVEALETIEQLRDWTSRMKVAEIVDALDREQVPVAPILQIDQAVEDPHVKARGIINITEHPAAGTVRSPGFPVKLSRTPGTIRLPAPTIGQHNEEVLTQLLGYTKEQVAELRKTGVIA
ncbi:MAG: CoA transferase, partial [Candidatus Bathyarchaeota archaeon]|nr:CoA transferase [Candidatus Bathyarchaeota archaeon]